ncbi:PadR family transcriptional regulator [Herbiconiux sp. A18JL235]|uniref:PadR family transcriptional regulator n=1 Tax=Herbiconiux sp. A18JL235 TaxID=3152363 RepID=A0AB39BKV5_9MICO
MSVRAGILALLSEGDAYGLQLHGELEQRTDRVGRVNVGQIYSTLERLSGADLVAAAGSTSDGLPLYRITELGRAEADTWFGASEVDSPTAWPDMVFKVLLCTSLGRPESSALLDGYGRAWRAQLDETQLDETQRDAAPPQADAAALARASLAHAAVRWLDTLASLPGGLPSLARELRSERPRRGRRPATTQE